MANTFLRKVPNSLATLQLPLWYAIPIFLVIFALDNRGSTASPGKWGSRGIREEVR